MPDSNSHPLVSVVILTWNRKDDLCDTLARLHGDRYKNLEVIVVDNGSTDGTDKAISSFNILYLPQNENLGIAGYNIGFKAAKGKYIVCLDSDSYPHPEAITRAVELFESCADISAIAFDVLTPDGEDTTLPPLTEPEETTGYHGAGTAFRRDVFEKAGYWHEPLFLYMNEMDHAIRMAKEGLKIVRTPAIRAFHKSSQTARPSENGPFYYLRNCYWLIWRHYPLADMFAATLRLIHMSMLESVKQGTSVYLRATIAALTSALPVMRQRQPMDGTLFEKIRIPFNLIFSRF